MSILASPGTYTVKLSAAGRELVQTLAVRKDPNLGGSEAEIAEQTKMLLDLRRDVETAADVVNRLEQLRNQLQSLSSGVKETAVLETAANLEARFTELEMKLVELRATGRGQDNVRFGAKLYSKLNYLGNGLASNDYGPTAQQIEVHQGLKEQLRQLEGTLNDLVTRGVAKLNEMLRANSGSPIAVPPPRKGS
jgi:hypothetical protein